MRLVSLQTKSELRQWRRSVEGSVGFVPTMGNLHQGHLSLLREARKSCDHVVLSIFVNPAQFGPTEDLETYPRTLEADLSYAQEAGVDAVFFPKSEELYPDGYSTWVEETHLSLPLCGAFRPGHFRGVTTIVLKLFNLVQPHRAYFGLKDAQQFFILKKMVNDLNLDLEVMGVPTEREIDGLAFSSRNQHLCATDRSKAPLIYQLLQKAKASLIDGAPALLVEAEARSKLSKEGFEVEYFDLRTLEGLHRAHSYESHPSRQYALTVAARLGRTRLIDNLIF